MKGTKRVEELRTELGGRIASYVGEAERKTSEIPGLLLVKRTSAEPATCMTYEPSLAVIAQGRKRVELGGRTFVYDESRYLLTSLELPIVSQMIGASEATPFLALAMKIDLGMVREILAVEEIAAVPAPSTMPAMTTGEVTAELLDACCRLVGLLSNPSDIPFLSGLIQREIVYRILRGAEGARLRAIATLGDQSHRTAKAIAWMRVNFSKAARVEELAGMAGMGVSTFHQHFRALTAMTPLQYQKQLRLNAARTRMLLDGIDAASAAYEVGYESASQFNREYSRFFGKPPMRDIRSMREGSAGEGRARE